jgi:hypothetical protein
MEAADLGRTCRVANYPVTRTVSRPEGSPRLANWFLIPTYYTFVVEGRDRVIELVMFVGPAGQ